MVKIVCQKKVFKGKLPKVKDYFVRSVGIMSSCKDIEDFKELLLGTFIVAESEYDGSNERGEKIVCSKKKSIMLERMKSYVIPENILEESYSDRGYDHLDLDICSEDIKTYINNIYEEAMVEIKSAEQTETGNDLYCPGITKHLICQTLFSLDQCYVQIFSLGI